MQSNERTRKPDKININQLKNLNIKKTVHRDQNW